MFTLIKSKLTLILISTILILGGIIAFQQNKIVNTMSLYTTSVANEKAAAEGLVVFKDKYEREHSRTKVFTKTVRDLESSEDYLTKKLLSTIKDSGIKLKNVDQAGIVKTKVDVTLKGEIKPSKSTLIDTITGDTLKVIIVKVVPDTVIDLSTKDVTNIITIKDSKIESRVALDNEQTIITSSHKETVKPRRKFFLWRLFQKKHWVVEVEIVNSNPLIQTKEQKFIVIPENKKN